VEFAMFELSIGMVKKVIASLNHVGNIGWEKVRWIRKVDEA